MDRPTGGGRGRARANQRGGLLPGVRPHGVRLPVEGAAGGTRFARTGRASDAASCAWTSGRTSSGSGYRPSMDFTNTSLSSTWTSKIPLSPMTTRWLPRRAHALRAVALPNVSRRWSTRSDTNLTWTLLVGGPNPGVMRVRPDVSLGRSALPAASTRACRRPRCSRRDDRARVVGYPARARACAR
jgi:hypothetical protein